jgi:hypothetical protein
VLALLYEANRAIGVERAILSSDAGSRCFQFSRSYASHVRLHAALGLKEGEIHRINVENTAASVSTN